MANPGALRRSGISLPLSLGRSGTVRQNDRLRQYALQDAAPYPPFFGISATGIRPNAPPRSPETPSCARAVRASSVFQKTKEDIRKLHPPTEKAEATLTQTGKRLWISASTGRRSSFGQAFPFSPKNTILGRRARTAPPTFFTQRHEDRIRNSHNGSRAPGPAPQCGSERAVLAGLILRPSAMGQIAPMLHPEDFYLPAASDAVRGRPRASHR